MKILLLYYNALEVMKSFITVLGCILWGVLPVPPPLIIMGNFNCNIFCVSTISPPSKPKKHYYYYWAQASKINCPPSILSFSLPYPLKMILEITLNQILSLC